MNNSFHTLTSVRLNKRDLYLITKSYYLLLTTVVKSVTSKLALKKRE